MTTFRDYRFGVVLLALAIVMLLLLPKTWKWAIPLGTLGLGSIIHTWVSTHRHSSS